MGKARMSASKKVLTIKGKRPADEKRMEAKDPKEAQIQELTKTLQRPQAEFDNYRKR